MSDFELRLRRDPSLYPHSYDPMGDALLMTELSQQEFEAASFLDRRIMTAQSRAMWANGAAVDAAMEAADSAGCRYIFHIGHVGSTLLSRMLGAHPTVHALREPATLRTLAHLWNELDSPESLVSPAAFDRRLTTLVKLWARTFTAAQRTVVKATSFASDLAPRLLAEPSSGTALAMFVRPETYIAGILGGENSRKEMQTLAQARLRRLRRRLGDDSWRLYELSEGERAAASWACEMAALEAVAAGRLGWIEFDAFLADPEAGLATAFAALGVDVGPGDVAAIAAGPLLTRYSKGPEHAYTPALRRQVLDQARQEHGDEIARGLRWLDAAGARHRLIGAALAR